MRRRSVSPRGKLEPFPLTQRLTAIADRFDEEKSDEKQYDCRIGALRSGLIVGQHGSKRTLYKGLLLRHQIVLRSGPREGNPGVYGLSQKVCHSQASWTHASASSRTQLQCPTGTADQHNRQVQDVWTSALVVRLTSVSAYLLLVTAPIVSPD